MIHEAHAHRSLWIGYVLSVFCFGLTVWSFYPGFMSADSVGQLTTGRAGEYSDISSPIMASLWGKLDQIVEGPALMLIFHNLLFWGACAIFWAATAKRSLKLGVALIMFGLLPSILPQLVCIWKDISLGASLLLAVSLIYFANARQCKLAILFSVLPLFYGFATRLNAIPAVVPIAIWSGFVGCRLFFGEGFKARSIAIGLAYSFVLTVGVYLVTYSLTDWKTTYPYQQIYLYDLAAISAANHESLVPEYISSGENFSPELVWSRYNTRTVNDLLYKDIPNIGDKPPLRFTEDRAELADLKAKWTEAVWSNPLTYLKHKASVFRVLIGLDRSISMTFFYEGFGYNPAEYRGNEHNPGYIVLMKYLGAFRRPLPQTLFHRAIVWMVLCIYFMYCSVKQKFEGDWEIVFVLSVSSMLFMLSYFPTTPSTEYRYLFWSALATAVTTIFGVYLIRTNRTEQVR